MSTSTITSTKTTFLKEVIVCDGWTHNQGALGHFSDNGEGKIASGTAQASVCRRLSHLNH